MNTNRVLGFSAALAVSLSACQQYDITQNFSENTKYADQFIEEFGEPDPLQEWSMVTQVTLKVTIGNAMGEPAGEIKVYSSDPYSANARVLASKEVEQNDLSLTFEASSHSAILYVTYLRENGFVEYKPVEVKDGMCEASFDIEEEEEDTPTAGARGNFDTKGTQAVDYWPGEVPYGQYDQIIPADAVSVTGYSQEINSYGYQGVKNILLNNATIEYVNLYDGNINVYVTGRTTVSRWYTGQNSTIHIMDGATLTVETQSSFAQNNTTWTICDDSKFIFKEKVEFAQNQTVYNKGRVQAPEFTVSNNTQFYNDGTLEVANTLHIANYMSVLVNNSTIHTTDLHISDGQLYNGYEGDVKVTKSTLVNSNNNVWYNRGHYTTKDFTFNAGSCNWINECHLLVTNRLDITLGGTIPVNNSYIETNSLYMNNSGIELGPNSQLVVTGTAEIGWNQYDSWNRRGLISTATGNEWAVFKANKVVTSSSTYMSYVGNVLVDCEDHFPAGEWGYPGITFIGNAKMAPGGDNYSIPGSDCSEPYNAQTPARPTEEPMSWIMACEDLGGTNDYDFNDVVFSISHMSGESYAIVTPLAAGGTLASFICYNDVPVRGDVASSEIHSMLNYMESTISGSMAILNTGRGHSRDYVGSPTRINLDNPNITIGELAQRFSVNVVTKGSDLYSGDYRVSKTVTRPTAGAMPQIILVPGTWKWPIERMGIKKAYPGFINWVQDATETDWASSAVDENIVESY